MRVPLILVELGPQSYHLLIEARLNGVETAFVLDSGASRSIIDTALLPADTVLIEPAEPMVAYGVDAGNVPVRQAHGVELSLGNGQWVRSLDFIAAELSAMRELYADACGRSIAGLLGCDFVLKHCNSINLIHRTICLRDRPRKRMLITKNGSK